MSVQDNLMPARRAAETASGRHGGGASGLPQRIRGLWRRVSVREQAPRGLRDLGGRGQGEGAGEDGIRSFLWLGPPLRAAQGGWPFGFCFPPLFYYPAHLGQRPCIQSLTSAKTWSEWVSPKGPSVEWWGDIDLKYQAVCCGLSRDY